MKIGYPNLPPGISKTRSGSANCGSAGSYAVTGVGFVPKIVLFFAHDNVLASDAHSHGWSNGAQHYCIFKRGGENVVARDEARCIVVYFSAANIIRAYISSMDADGFTLTWDLTGTGTATFIYLAMR